MLGTYALSSGYYDAYYGQAQKVRTKIAEDFSAAFADFDFVVTPTSPSVAFGLGEKTDDPLAMYLNDFFTVPMQPRRHPGDLDPGRSRRARRAAARGSRSASRSPPRPSPSRGCSRRPTRSRARSASTPSRRAAAMAELEAVIGLEIHVQLSTRTKMFCGCELSFGDEPNVHTCPVCLAHPGVLPVPNEQAILYALKIAAALGVRGRAALDLPPQELLLSRQPEGLPDQPVRHSACQRRPARRRPHPPRPPRGGRGEDDPRRRVRPDPRLRRLAGRLQPRRHAAGRDRHRARPARRRRGGRVGAAAARRRSASSASPTSTWRRAACGVDANVSVRPAGSEELGTKTELKNMNSFRFLAARDRGRAGAPARADRGGGDGRCRRRSTSTPRAAR